MYCTDIVSADKGNFAQNRPQGLSRLADYCNNTELRAGGAANLPAYVTPAAVAELADAQASGACVLRDVEVRLLSAAVS